MTHKDIFKEAFPQNRQIGGSHYKKMKIQPYEFISKNNLSFFQGNVVEVCLQVFEQKWYTRLRKDYTLLRAGNKKIKRY